MEELDEDGDKVLTEEELQQSNEEENIFLQSMATFNGKVKYPKWRSLEHSSFCHFFLQIYSLKNLRREVFQMDAKEGGEDEEEKEM